MSFFAVVLVGDEIPDFEGVAGIGLVPLPRAQSCIADRARNELSYHGASRAFAVVDETGDTASRLVAEIQRQVRIEDLPLMETRLGRLVAIAARARCTIHAWWGDVPIAEAWSTFPVYSECSEFLAAVLEQLEEQGGIVRITFRPPRRRHWVGVS